MRERELQGEDWDWRSQVGKAGWEGEGASAEGVVLV